MDKEKQLYWLVNIEVEVSCYSGTKSNSFGSGITDDICQVISAIKKGNVRCFLIPQMHEVTRATAQLIVNTPEGTTVIAE